jgi:pimeloyl-ACP methyl ester carboxylesterase
VNKDRIGVIGHSLGGHNSLFTAVFDDRIKAVVTSCGFTPFHDYYGGKVAGWTSDRYMPIIGDVWLEDPLPSSYPPSIAFKAAELQDHTKALVFLRRMREQVLVEKKNITKWPVIAEAAVFAQLDTARLHTDFTGAANALFQADLTLARSLGVRGFPTFIFSNAAGERQVVYGARPYAQFEAAVKQLLPSATHNTRPSALPELFALHHSWCAEEVAVMLGLTHEAALAMLRAAEGRGELSGVHTRNGSVWRQK